MNEAGLPTESGLTPLSPRKQAIRERNDRLAPERARWRAKNATFHADNTRYMRFLVPPGLDVLELGCGAGDVLHHATAAVPFLRCGGGAARARDGVPHAGGGGTAGLRSTVACK